MSAVPLSGAAFRGPSSRTSLGSGLAAALAATAPLALAYASMRYGSRSADPAPPPPLPPLPPTPGPGTGLLRAPVPPSSGTAASPAPSATARPQAAASPARSPLPRPARRPGFPCRLCRRCRRPRRPGRPCPRGSALAGRRWSRPSPRPRPSPPSPPSRPRLRQPSRPASALARPRRRRAQHRPLPAASPPTLPSQTSNLTQAPVGMGERFLAGVRQGFSGTALGGLTDYLNMHRAPDTQTIDPTTGQPLSGPTPRQQVQSDILEQRAQDANMPDWNAGGASTPGTIGNAGADIAGRVLGTLATPETVAGAGLARSAVASGGAAVRAAVPLARSWGVPAGLDAAKLVRPLVPDWITPTLRTSPMVPAWATPSALVQALGAYGTVKAARGAGQAIDASAVK